MLMCVKEMKDFINFLLNWNDSEAKYVSWTYYFYIIEDDYKSIFY